MGVRSISLAAAIVLTAACDDVLTTRAPNTGEARQQLQAGGWWPSGIPDSATAILEGHDLDTNAQKIIFSVESEPCRQAAATMVTSVSTKLGSIPALPLEGWPAWLSSEVTLDSILQRRGVVAAAERGNLLLMCEDRKGYFWRSEDT